MFTLSNSQPFWLAQALERIKYLGYAVVEDVLDTRFLEQTRKALYHVQNKILAELGRDRLQKAGELGVLRLMMKYDAHFYLFLEIPEVLEILDNTITNTCLLHTQNGIILPSFRKGETPTVAQNRFHMDFPRFLMGYVASINILFAIDAFTEENGATIVLPSTHQKSPPPQIEYTKDCSVVIACRPGSMLIFDSTLWHAAGQNLSEQDRLAVNMQFTRSWIKQQIDYVRAIGDVALKAQRARTQQLLGGYTRVVTSLDEYYRPEEERLYRPSQG